jgi:hypothetical protein
VVLAATPLGHQLAVAADEAATGLTVWFGVMGTTTAHAGTIAPTGERPTNPLGPGAVHNGPPLITHLWTGAKWL